MGEKLTCFGLDVHVLEIRVIRHHVTHAAIAVVTFPF
jgi:predicted NodU family carbamoyl transferase